MTVCVAALCNGGSLVIGASDRMFSMASGHRWEPEQTKLAHLTTSIVGMLAADSVAFPLAVIYELQEWVNQNVFGSPQVWLSVRQVAEKYCEIYRAHRQRLAEIKVLSSLNLTLDGFVLNQHLMKPEIVSELWGKIKNVWPQSEMLFAGVDSSGAHLYLASNDLLTCEDAAGFTAIGEGAEHAIPFLASARYSKNNPGPLALYLTYSAKRRGELASSVGVQTDMFGIGPAVGSFQPILPPIIKDLKSIYDAQEASISQAYINAQQSAKAYWESIMKASAQAAAAQTQDTGAKPEAAAPTPPNAQDDPGPKKPDATKKRRQKK